MNLHNIKLTLLKYTNQGHLLHSPCCPTTASNSRMSFIIQRGNPVPTGSHSPSLGPRPLATTDLLSVSVDLPALDISCKWNHLTCDLLHLTSFTQHDVFKVHPHFSLCPLFPSFSWLSKIPLCGWAVLFISFHPSMNKQAVSAFQLL